MSLLDELRSELSGLEGDAKREFLKSIGVDVPEPAEPPKPPTLLDKIRDVGLGALHELELLSSEIPGAHEVAPVLGIVIKVVDDLGKRVDQIESSQGAAASSKSAGESPARVSPAADGAKQEQAPATDPASAPAPAPPPAPDSPDVPPVEPAPQA